MGGHGGGHNRLNRLDRPWEVMVGRHNRLNRHDRPWEIMVGVYEVDELLLRQG